MKRKEVMSKLKEIDNLLTQTQEINKKVQELKKEMGSKEQAASSLEFGHNGRAAVGIDGLLHVQVVLSSDEEIKALINYLTENLEGGLE
jgi:hypothetical protein